MVALFDGRVRYPWRRGAIAGARLGCPKRRIDNMKEPPRESRDRQAKQAKSYIGSFFVSARQAGALMSVSGGKQT